MSAAIARAKEAMSDPDAALSEKINAIGILAIGILLTGTNTEETEEARRLVADFGREMGVNA